MTARAGLLVALAGAPAACQPSAPAVEPLVPIAIASGSSPGTWETTRSTWRAPTPTRPAGACGAPYVSEDGVQFVIAESRLATERAVRVSDVVDNAFVKALDDSGAVARLSGR